MLRRFSVLSLGVFLTGCLTTAPLHPEAVRHNTAGVRHLQSGRLESASTCFHLSLEYNPCHPDALHNLALISLLQGDLQTAETREQEALTCRPDLVQAVNGLGVVKRAQGSLEEALDLFEQAIAMDPGYLEARKNLILTALDVGKQERAQVQLNRLAILAPDDPFISEVSDVLHSVSH
jgi:Flp pilus assembly protein TadD